MDSLIMILIGAIFLIVGFIVYKIFLNDRILNILGAVLAIIGIIIMGIGFLLFALSPG